ncbi:hypothetical protein B0J15DRAFT_473086 [Fusarium solani]|uniref:Uncharacterized protein n=1 Tax=Fusarium solani TaxID=169388 RepID=A0A9P9G0P6_FUSSL|nr:uncharacterized protein B0J15DRAFT_473086 [Fusarium solani]KAH7230361.1 hypothetical protein B0J15DRAFT_473086 [Fusarium solani]
MPRKPDIFVNYEGPKLRRDQKFVVQSRAMVSVRAKMKDAMNQRSQKKALQLAESETNSGNAEYILVPYTYHRVHYLSNMARDSAPHPADAGDVSESLSSVQSRSIPHHPGWNLVLILPRAAKESVNMGVTGEPTTL